MLVLKYCSENLFLNIQINIPLENNPVETFLVFTYVLLYPYLEFDHQTIVTVHWYEIENTKRKEMRYWWPMFWWCLLILIRLPHRDITLCRLKSMYNHVYHWHKELNDKRNLHVYTGMFSVFWSLSFNRNSRLHVPYIVRSKGYIRWH